MLRCKTTSNDDTSSSLSSGVDTEPLTKHPDADSGAGEFEDTTQEQDAPPGYVAPVVAQEDDGGGFMSGFFDGANDQPHRPNFHGDGPSDGYWAYVPYHRGQGMYNESLQWASEPDQPAGGPSTGFPYQVHASQPPDSHKRVHFDMGGPPNTRVGPPPGQPWPRVAIPPPSRPPPRPNVSNHGAGQYGGYPVFPQPIPFNAVPPAVWSQTAPEYGTEAASGYPGYIPYTMYPGYGYGFGAGPEYGHHSQAYYQGQGYEQRQGGPGQGPAVYQNGNTSSSADSWAPAQNQNNQDNGWEDSNNAGNTSGNAGGDGGWSGNNAGNTNTPGGGGGWTKDNPNNNTGSNDWIDSNDNNETTNDEEKSDGWNDDNRDNVNNNGDDTQTGWGDTHDITAPQQDNGGWEKNELNDNQASQDWGSNDSKIQKQNQGNDNWGDNKQDNNAISPLDGWSQAEAEGKAELAQEQYMPGTFPSGQPRTLYGPHGPYYMLETISTAGSTKAEVEEEPRYDVPVSHVEQTGSTHQVQPGRGYLYVHRCAKPTYIDSVESPYARFVFKYRTKQQISDEIGVQVDVEPSLDPEVKQLAGKSKEEIIDMLLRAKSALGGRIPEPPEKLARELANGLKPIVVPAPARRVGEYKIPTRPMSNQRRSEGIGLGIPDWQRLPPASHNAGRSNNNNYKHQDHTNANTNVGGGWFEQDQNQNQNQNSSGWDAGAGVGGGDYGDAGARPSSEPASPQQQGGGAWAADHGGGGAAAAQSGGQSGW